MEDDRKQYAKKVVVNAICVVAQTLVGIKPSDEEIEMIPEDLVQDITAAIGAAMIVKKETELRKLMESLSSSKN